MKHTIKAIPSASHALSSQAITETPPAVEMLTRQGATLEAVATRMLAACLSEQRFSVKVDSFVGCLRDLAVRRFGSFDRDRDRAWMVETADSNAPGGRGLFCGGRDSPQAIILGKRLGMEKFNPSPNQFMSGKTTRGVTVSLFGNSPQFRHAFMGLKTGPPRVLQRDKSFNPKSKNKDPRFRLKNITAPTVPQMADDKDYHRGEVGYVNGEQMKIEKLGPLPEGWSTEPPPPPPYVPPPDTRTPEEKRRAAYRREADPIVQQIDGYAREAEALRTLGEEEKALAADAKAKERLLAFLAKKDEIRARYPDE